MVSEKLEAMISANLAVLNFLLPDRVREPVHRVRPRGIALRCATEQLHARAGVGEALVHLAPAEQPREVDRIELEHFPVRVVR